MSPTNPVIEHYFDLIDELAKNSDRNFGAIGDPLFEMVRFYSYGPIKGSFDYGLTTELAPDKVNDIECLLMQSEEPVLLFAPLLKKLKTVAPAFNKKGKCVFLASWGMGPEEIGWCIRYLNGRSVFEQYLTETGITETEVNLYNESYEDELKQTQWL